MLRVIALFEANNFLGKQIFQKSQSESNFLHLDYQCYSEHSFEG